MIADGHLVGDGSWELKVLVTDLSVERCLRVKGDLHIGGVMLRLVEELGMFIIIIVVLVCPYLEFSEADIITPQFSGVSSLCLLAFKRHYEGAILSTSEMSSSSIHRRPLYSPSLAIESSADKKIGGI